MSVQEKIDYLRYSVKGGLIKRDVCADRYAEIIGLLNKTRDIDEEAPVAGLNQDIVNCWSAAGLWYIKKKAWKIWNEFHEGQ